MLRVVLQECHLSPLLFNIYMMGMVDELERAQLGVNLEEHSCALFMRVIL